MSGSAPTWRSRPNVSMSSHSSSIFPPRQRLMVRRLNATSRPVGGTPMRSPGRGRVGGHLGGKRELRSRGLERQVEAC
jgi:hypothetical protein